LNANSFGVLAWFQQRVDDAARNAVSPQFDGCGEADRPSSNDEYIGIGHTLPPHESNQEI
jgi:hypothetical protein